MDDQINYKLTFRESFNWVFIFLLENGLACQAIGPLLRVWRHESWVRRAPFSNLLSAHTPMKNQIVIRVSISCNEINSEPVSGNSSSSILSIIIVVDIFLTVWGESNSRVNYWRIELVFGCCLLLRGTWVVWTVIWKLISSSIECLMSDENMERYAVSHMVLIVLEVGVLLQKQ